MHDDRHTYKVIGLQVCNPFKQRFLNGTQVRTFGLSDSILELIESMLKKPIGHIKAPISILLEIVDKMLPDAKAAATIIHAHVMRLKTEFYNFLKGKASVPLSVRGHKNFSSGEEVGWPVALLAQGATSSPFIELLGKGMGIIR